MSMKMLTILQFISVFGAYTFLTVLLPAIVFHHKFREERAIVRIFLYLTIGNFFYINLVYLLQILHISNRFTLIIGTVLGVFFAVSRVHRMPPRESFRAVKTILYKLLSGTLGYRLVLGSIGNRIKKVTAELLDRMNDSIKKYFLDWVLTIVVTAVFLWIYGTSKIEIFGYTASDMPVHNYWVNAMGNGINNVKNNDIFVAGVYPFGFHCIIYYIHTVFNIETYILFRIFSLVQVLFIHYMLLAFLRGCCKTRYLPYGAVIVYILASFWGSNAYLRYYSTLPQEFGMIFILPSIYFLFRFFEIRKKEVSGILKKGSMRYLIGFAMSFSLTFSAHFYDTIVAGILCVGIAVGYFFRLFRKAYFGRVMLTGIISILIAILPLGAAFAMGTPLEGSLYWAMNVISSGGEEDTSSGEQETTNIQEIETDNLQTEATSTDVQNPGGSGGTADWQNTPEDASSSGGEPSKGTIQGMIQKLTDKLHNLKEKGSNAAKAVYNGLKTQVITKGSDSLCRFVFFCMGVMAVFGILYLLGEDKEYGGILLSLSSGILFMMLMLVAGKIGLPNLLETGRCSLYLTYLLPVAPVLAADVILWTLFEWMKKSAVRNGISLAMTVSWVLILIMAGKVRFPLEVSGLEPYETNDAITCLTNIIKENKVGTYTICSANDELRMVQDYGYFYEIINFLREMEGEETEEILTIPTEYVYFFIEKVPIDYTVSYERSGQVVSEEGAAHRLPRGSGLGLYQAKNRWILMSRMYYWAQEFQNLYENEMKVYYESDNFICYQVTQNPYRLFDFSIDYGYNTMFE